MSKLIITLFSLIYAPSIYAQLPDQIKKEAAEVLISISTEDTINQIVFEDLDVLIKSETSNDELGIIYLVSPGGYDRLKSQLAQIESLFKNVSADSGLVLFNSWYLQFCNTFYDYLKNQFDSSKKIKVLFFSASVSCHCTLEMCKNQLIDILKYFKENGDEYDYWVVDSYWHNELQIEYETFFAPSVIAFDGEDKVLYKIEYAENMIDSLKGYFKNGLNGSK